jgi:hypothetical protein
VLSSQITLVALVDCAAVLPLPVGSPEAEMPPAVQATLCWINATTRTVHDIVSLPGIITGLQAVGDRYCWLCTTAGLASLYRCELDQHSPQHLVSVHSLQMEIPTVASTLTCCQWQVDAASGYLRLVVGTATGLLCALFLRPQSVLSRSNSNNSSNSNSSSAGERRVSPSRIYNLSHGAALEICQSLPRLGAMVCTAADGTVRVLSDWNAAYCAEAVSLTSSWLPSLSILSEDVLVAYGEGYFRVLLRSSAPLYWKTTVGKREMPGYWHCSLSLREVCSSHALAFNDVGDMVLHQYEGSRGKKGQSSLIVLRTIPLDNDRARLLPGKVTCTCSVDVGGNACVSAAALAGSSYLRVLPLGELLAGDHW